MRGVSARATRAGSRLSVACFDVDEDGPRPGLQDRERRERRRDRARDDLVARADPERAQRELEGVGAVRDRDGVLRAERRRQLGFERLALGAEHEPARVEHARHGRVELAAQLAHVRREVEEGDAHR